MWETAKLLEVAYDLLLVAGKPLKTDEMASTLKQLGCFPSEWDLKRCSHEVYCKLWYRWSKNKDGCLWQRVGKGTWVAIEYMTVDHVLQEEKNAPRTMEQIRSTMKMEGRAPRLKPVPLVFDGTIKCGNCAHIFYHGPHELTMLEGECRNESESARPYTAANSIICAGFKQRTEAQKASDREAQNLARIKVNAINISCRGRRSPSSS